MTNDEMKAYLSERYCKEIQFYDNRAIKYKKYYHYFQWVVIILLPIVPVLVSTLENDYKIITIIVSIILAICTTSLKTFKYQENWLNYRTIAETMKKEKYYFDANIGEYSNVREKNALFVERVESLISRENTLWINTSKQKAKKEGKE